MITKNYGDSSEDIYNKDFYNRAYKNSLELLKYSDISSANTFNRSILKLYEEVANNSLAFQSFSKLLLQNKSSCYIDGILEGFGSVKTITFNNKKYIRIPTGVLVINKSPTSNNGDDFNNRKIATDDNVSIYVNAPKVSLFEREIAEHFGIDLNEGLNSVNVNYDVSDNEINYNYEISTLVKRTTDGDEPILSVNTKSGPNNGELKNVSELVSDIYSQLNGFVKKDENYSLEEIIPLPLEASSDNYIYVFFNTDANNIKTDTDEKKYSYSHSGKFGICVSSSEQQTVDNDILLFQGTLDNNLEIVNEISVLKKLNRNLLELKNLDVSNTISVKKNGNDLIKISADDSKLSMANTTTLEMAGTLKLPIDNNSNVLYSFVVGDDACLIELL